MNILDGWKKVFWDSGAASDISSGEVKYDQVIEKGNNQGAGRKEWLKRLK
jgi:hypothetical protein